MTPPSHPHPLPPSDCSLDHPWSSPPSLCQVLGRWFREQSAVDSKSPSPGFAVARGPAERVPACVVLQLLWAHRALRLAPAHDVPVPPAPPGAGTVRGWACGWHPAHHSFPNLFTSNQTNPSSPALNGDCAVSQDDRRAAVSTELPSVGFTRDRCLAWLLGTSEATLENSMGAPQKVKP